jgi:hypothetical protein
VNQVFRNIIASVAPALDLDHPTRRADGRAPSPLAAEAALINDILNAPPEKFGRLSDGELFADAFDGGCPADVCSDPAHGGRGGTMGHAAASLPPLSKLPPLSDAENKRRAGINLLKRLHRRVNCGDVTDTRKIADDLELALMMLE